MDVPEEAYITPLRLVPGARNLNQDTQGRKATPISAVGDLNVTLKDIQEDRENIRTMLYNDLLKLPLQDRMTTMEVDYRRQEQLALLAPFLVRLEQEYFDKIVERVIGILYRQGILPEKPEAISGDTDIVIMYDSPLARAMRFANVKAVDQTLAFIGQVASFSPEVIDNFDFDAITRGRAEDTGIPLAYMRGKEDIDKIRQQRQQAQQQAQEQAQQAQQMAAVQGISDSVNKVGNTPGMENLSAQVAQMVQDAIGQAQQNNQNNAEEMEV